jgi:hypothetical protein
LAASLAFLAVTLEFALQHLKPKVTLSHSSEIAKDTKPITISNIVESGSTPELLKAVHFSLVHIDQSLRKNTV